MAIATLLKFLYIEVNNWHFIKSVFYLQLLNKIRSMCKCIYKQLDSNLLKKLQGNGSFGFCFYTLPPELQFRIDWAMKDEIII